MNSPRLSTVSFAALVALALSGCGGGGNPASTPHAMARISQSANTLLMSDLLLSTDFLDVRAQADCAGTNCTWTAFGEEVTVSLSELMGETTGEWPEASETRRGVSVFKVSELIDGDDGSLGLADAYGGWLEYNWFFVASFVHMDDTFGDVSAPVSMSIGNATGSNPVRGSATWSGVISGVDVSDSNYLNQIQGDADLTISDFADPGIDVAFTNIRDVDAGRPRADMAWDDVPMTGGGFATGSDGNSIQGKFYGPDHGEAGGVFERDQVIGAFGARRR